LNEPVPFAQTYFASPGISPSPPFGVSAGNPGGSLQDTFLLSNAGVYELTYSGEFTEPGQLAIHYQAAGIGAFVRLPHSGKGRAVGSSMLGTSSLVNAAALSRVRVVNDTSIGALTPTPPASSGTGDLAVNLIIKQLR
jgi:hypothetical protein